MKKKCNLKINGDLAIEVTEQYTKRFGMKGTITQYRELEKILAESRLNSDLDQLLEPYSLFIDRISVEEVYAEYFFNAALQW